MGKIPGAFRSASGWQCCSPDGTLTFIVLTLKIHLQHCTFRKVTFFIYLLNINLLFFINKNNRLPELHRHISKKINTLPFCNFWRCLVLFSLLKQNIIRWKTYKQLKSISAVNWHLNVGFDWQRETRGYWSKLKRLLNCNWNARGKGCLGKWWQTPLQSEKGP